MIYTVRKPFYCRPGQFSAAGYPGQVLVVGILLAAVTRSEIQEFHFKIGKSKTLYSGDCARILEVGYLWHNPEGKDVLIVPVEVFKKRVPEKEKILTSSDFMI